ncbi:yhhF [Wigglesworthia glossinidia endosymbiont of Glossina brevipalpis]|uniref:Ribosomal RNA small subunit methyltransferase D n=1 Tax=Wigglesworthia glossinidia brevipalpis TaxID=36870 RepID=Q8D3D1_WIGBR|nr:yhhF [Wigglesworthia glossinidia endosymbiont of Glossina brevipalpis]
MIFLKKKLYKNKISIIGGKWKNKKFILSKRIYLRPTLGYIRETLFNWLEPFVENAYCLDCFSGTGMLGSEALSRKAKYVVFLDKNIELNNILSQNLKHLKCNNYYIINTNTIKWLNNPKLSFDIVFIDPPYINIKIVNTVINFLEKNFFLKKKSWIYIEINKKNLDPIVPNNWMIYRKKNTKNISYYLYERNN